MDSRALQFVIQTYQRPYRPAARNVDPYTAFICELARKFTNSPEEAKAAVKEMQSDIQRCAEKGPRLLANEDRLIQRIAFRRLIKFLQ